MKASWFPPFEGETIRRGLLNAEGAAYLLSPGRYRPPTFEDLGFGPS
jgi:hypothetical protein